MNLLRTASGRNLGTALALAVALALTAAVAQGALGGSAPRPAPKALAAAILAAFDAAEPAGITARIEFENDLLPSGALPRGTASPLMSGADGRLWMQADGDFRVELQSDAGDAQIVAAGDRLSVYDAGSQTVYRATLRRDAAGVARRGHGGEEQLTLAKVRQALDRLARTWTISGADQTSTAGRPTYTVRISPRDRGGLLGAAALAWDALRGVPLRAAVYAEGRSEPVLELQATAVSYGAVAEADVRVAPPAGTEVVDLDPRGAPRRGAARGRGAPSRRRSAVEGVAAVRRQMDFRLRAPATLAGLRRRTVRLMTFDGKNGALAIYGSGLSAIAVLQRKADPSDRPRPRDRMRRARGELRLPQIDVGGATGTQLATPLGTIVTFERGGVAYVVAGSVPAGTAQSAARGLR